MNNAIVVTDYKTELEVGDEVEIQVIYRGKVQTVEDNVIQIGTSDTDFINFGITSFVDDFDTDESTGYPYDLKIFKEDPDQFFQADTDQLG